MHQFSSFAEFWPYYLYEHRSRVSRVLHYLGTVLATFLTVLLIAKQQWFWLPLILVAGYLPAWIGHFIIERNRPATFQHPLWSLRADFTMLFHAITGQLANEIKRLDTLEPRN